MTEDEFFEFVCFGGDDDAFQTGRRMRAEAAIELIRSKPEMTFVERRGLGNLLKDYYMSNEKRAPGRPKSTPLGHGTATWVHRKEDEWLQQNGKKKIPSQKRRELIAAGITLRRKYRPNAPVPTEGQVMYLLKRKERLFPPPRMSRSEIQAHFDYLQKLGAFNG